jgi:hypothetical protein
VYVDTSASLSAFTDERAVPNHGRANSATDLRGRTLYKGTGTHDMTQTKAKKADMTRVVAVERDGVYDTLIG